VTLVFTPIGDGFWMTQSQESNLPRLVSRAAPAGPNTVTLTTTNTRDCPRNSAGTYEWSLSPSGETLTLGAQDDTCASRLAAVPGTYWRMNCPKAGDNCLGPVDAGTYSSQFFDPFVPHGAAWTPRYGALEYTVPEGWENREDWPEFFGLGPVDAAGSPFIQFASGVVAVKDDDMCSNDPNPTAARSAEALAAWVAAVDGVETDGAPEPVTVAGLPAWRLDVRIADGWTAKCPWNDTDKPDRPLFTDVEPGEGFHWGIPPDGSMRIWLVDLGDGRALLIEFEAETHSAYDAGLVAATAVVGSLVLNR
jgi:hypothetical protein